MLNRVDGCLALSRAIGDLEYKDRDDLPPEKQAVSPFPDVLVKERDEYDIKQSVEKLKKYVKEQELKREMKYN